MSNDFVFATGVGGIMYKLMKRDLCKLMVKSKEKFKSNLVEKLVQISRSKESSSNIVLTLRFGNTIVDDSDEKYLYEENDCTITNFQVSPDSCSGHGKINPDSYLQKYAKSQMCYSGMSKSRVSSQTGLLVNSKKKDSGVSQNLNQRSSQYMQDVNDAKFVNYY